MLDLALVHYPVCNRQQEVIGSAVTNLDLHDLARAGMTYGVGKLFIVTPYRDQQQLVMELVDHWRHGHGARHNPDRRQAWSIVQLCAALDEVYDHYAQQATARPLTVATSAQVHDRRLLSYREMGQRLADGQHYLLLFGTGWGLAPAILEQVDAILPPLTGVGQYNHLSVRSACSIILDRLLGDR